ncbi:hypothetical protein JG687_00003737 [Phytophthora cactorum]|uniref:Uncharacterized protein n=1 Tax=Phytophthora cactorum TaxID=29920 RepID=A0A8T1UVB9_9STRA|nr:hypothetical protein JG687_00003737 [Phytophthora cactorum]
MVDRLIHNRVFKVSKELNRLDLLCEQHRRQIGHREGLPDWERPNTPAGKASGRHGRTPAFFAWDEESEHRPRPTWQTETPQKVARTLHLTPTRGEREKDRQPAPERSPHENVGEDVLETATSLPSEQVELEGMDEASAIEVDRDDRSVEEEQPVGTGRTIAVSPIREDILDRVHPPNARTSVSSRNLTLPLTVEAAPSPYHPPSSPRYRHGRRLQANDAAIPTPRAQQYAAGVTTQQADRYRMSRTSGKRFRSPAKPTTLWDDLCNTYIHQSAASSNTNTNPTSFSRKRTTNSAAERAFGGSSVFPTVNTDTYGWPGSESSGFNRRPVLTGSEAMNVANHAVREFLGGRDEETNQSEPPMESRQRSGESDRVAGTVELPGEVPNASTTGSRTGNNRKSKRGSEIRYRLKLTRPPSKGKAVTIHVRVIMNKIGITASPSHLVVTSKDWRQIREITVSSSADSELRTFQIHHKIHETYDEVYNATAQLPSLFVSVLQKEATFLFGFGCGIDGRLGTDGDTNLTTPTPFASRGMWQ